MKEFLVLGAGLRFIFVVALALTAACGDDDGDAGDGKSGPASLSRFAEEYSALACERLADCCAMTSSPVSASDCKQKLEGAVMEGGAAVDSGASMFNEQAAGACLSALRESTACDQSATPPICQTVVTGTKAAGATCSSDADCAAPMGGSASCDSFEKKCVQQLRVELGDACNTTCTEVVDEGSSSLNCVGDGSTTRTFREARCFTNDGSFCGANGTCEARRADGASCADSSECADGLFCATTEDTSECSRIIAVGESCAGNSSDECGGKAYCANADQTCQATIELGGACDVNADDEPCGSDAQCNEAGKCEGYGLGGDLLELACGFFAG